MKYATFRCDSIMYPIIETYAVACDDFPECDGELDEKFCSDDNFSNIFFTVGLTFVATVYLLLKGGRLTKQKISQKKIYKSEMNEKGEEEEGTEEFLDKYCNRHKNGNFQE